MTQKQVKHIWKIADNTPPRTIYDCYDNPSRAIEKAEADIISTMLNENGYNYKVLSYNRCIFTCCYYIDVGEGVLIHYFTPNYDLYIRRDGKASRILTELS